MLSSKNALPLDSLPPLKDVIAEHKLSAQKALGQNFLLDQNITDKIIRLVSEHFGDFTNLNLIEIGPGPGGLTRSMLNTNAASVTAIEFDSRAVRALQDLKTAAENRLEILESDALKTDLSSIQLEPRAIIANLPYNIATPLLIGWLKQIRTNQETYAFMALMFQKEVAERILAGPGNKTYGRLSVMTQWLCDVKAIIELPPSVFTPPPKIRSSVVFFKPKILPEDAPRFDAMEKICAAAFNQRRKMIRSSLKPYIKQIEELDLNPTLRAEQLSVQNYIDLAKALEGS